MAKRPQKNRSKNTDRKKGVARRDVDSHVDYSESMPVLIGRNPVLEAMESGREIEKIFIQRGVKGPALKVASQARKKGIPVQFVDKAKLDKLAEGGAHQGLVALVSQFNYSTIDDILQRASQRGEDPFIILCDGIEDPHNLGAIIRTAECAGAHGVVIPKRRSASVNATVEKTSAGATSYMLVARVANISNTINRLKEGKVWIACADMGGETYYDADLKGGIALVVGSEGFGVGQKVKEACDFVLSIPMKGQINSLNASNAATVLMYEVRRQRSIVEQ